MKRSEWVWVCGKKDNNFPNFLTAAAAAEAQEKQHNTAQNSPNCEREKKTFWFGLNGE